jgi:hypothetical protein
MTGALAQGIGSEFKLQYWKKKLHVDHGDCLETLSSSFILPDELMPPKFQAQLNFVFKHF